MKKTITALLFLLTLAVGQAQKGGSPFGANMFMSGQLGASFYNNKYGFYPGFSGGIAVGKWITEPLALRVTLDVMTNNSPLHLREDALSHEVANYTFANVDMLWDFNATFSRVKGGRFQLYPMVGLGIVWRDSINVNGYGSSVDHEVQVMLGAQANLRISKSWVTFLEYKAFFLPQEFDGTYGNVIMNSLTLGVTRNFYDSPFHRRTLYESRATGNDWFVGLGLGPNVSTFDLMYFNPKYGMWGFAPEVMAGRNLTEFWTLRFELNGITGHERYDTVNGAPGDGYAFSNLHADIMVNLSHLIAFRRGARFHVMPYLGAGLVWRYDNIQFDLASDFGLFLRYCVSRRSDVYADLKYIMVPTPIGGGPGPSGSFYSVGLPSFTVGYIYNFGTNTTRYRIPANWCPE